MVKSRIVEEEFPTSYSGKGRCVMPRALFVLSLVCLAVGLLFCQYLFTLGGGWLVLVGWVVAVAFICAGVYFMYLNELS